MMMTLYLRKIKGMFVYLKEEGIIKKRSLEALGSAFVNQCRHSRNYNASCHGKGCTKHLIRHLVYVFPFVPSVDPDMQYQICNKTGHRARSCNAVVDIPNASKENKVDDNWFLDSGASHHKDLSLESFYDWHSYKGSFCTHLKGLETASVIVIGGGISGVSAACALKNAHFKVISHFHS